MLRLHPRQLPSRRRVSLLAQPPARRRDSAEAEDRGRVLRLHQGHMQQRVRLTPLPQTPARSPEGSRATRHARETPADQKARTLFTIDACSFSRRVRYATRLPLSFLPPPLTITRPTPQGRVPFLARRAGGRGVRETRGERREPDFVQGAAEAASGPGGEAGGLFGLARRPPSDGRALSRDRLKRETRETRRTSRERERERIAS
jgi:hypothetical protein